MTVLSDNTKETSGTIVKGVREFACSSTDDQPKQTSEEVTHDGEIPKEKAEKALLRQTAAFIADALLQLGGSEDGSDNSSRDYSNKKRTRAISIVADTDASSTGSQSTDTETDVTSSDTRKRRRKIPNQEPSPIPTKLCLPNLCKSPLSLHGVRTTMKSKISSCDEEDQALSFSTKEFPIQYQNFNAMKIPGDIGCISQFFHEDFRPLRAAPRLPCSIVPEDPPPMMYQPYGPPAPLADMYSAVFTGNNDCLIVHSSTMLSRPLSQHMAWHQHN
jgi:hypothetical protein